MKGKFYTIALGDVVLTQKGIKPLILKSQPFSESVPYLDIRALETGEIREYTFKELGNIASENDILVVWDGSRSGLALKGKYGAIGSTIMKLTPVGFHPDFIFYFIKSKYDFINGNLTGGGIPHVNPRLFFNLQIPFVPLSVQKEIVENLVLKIKENDFLITKQKDAIKKALEATNIPYDQNETINESIDNFRFAILNNGVSGKLTEVWRSDKKRQFSFKNIKLGAVITEIKSGKSFRCLERPPTPEETGVLKISAITSFEYIENESKTCIDKDRVNPDLFIKKDDFLMTRANTKELVGACVIVKEVHKRIMLSDKILRINFDNTVVLKEFILLFLRSKKGRDQIESYATGSQESMKNITQTSIRDININIPTLDEQKEIVRQTNALLAVADKIQKQYQSAVQTLHKLENSLLNSVFEEKSLIHHQRSISVEKEIGKIAAQKKSLESERIMVAKSHSKARSIMKRTVTQQPTLDIEEVLKSNPSPMPAKEVWESSRYSKDIDAFYEAIKQKVNKSIRWDVIKKEESVPESILYLNNDL